MDGATAVRIRLLDGFSLTARRSAGRPVELPHGVQRLVARLSLSGRRARSALAGELWPAVAQEHAQGSLRSALWRLQKVVPGLVDVRGSALALAAGVRVDVVELVAWGRRVHDATVDALAVPEAALCGELLPGWSDDWVVLERERLRQLRVHGLETASSRLAAAGRYGDALQMAYAAVQAEPLRESAHRAVVRLHLVEGNVGEAQRAYEVFRGLLADELGVGPSERMTRLLGDLPAARSA